MGKNYFNSLPWREALLQLGHCRFMEREEFNDGTNALKGKKIVIIGCGAQGLNQGLNLRDSGLDVSYALRKEAIAEKRASWRNATENGFKVGAYDELIPTADVVGNLTPDKQHSKVIAAVMPLMKKGAALWYSHGFNMVEEGMEIRPDITVVMMAPKGPGSEVRTEYKRGFGIPTLIAVHPVNDPEKKGWPIAKALAVATGGSRAGVLESSFIAEVKSDLMGEQTILCGMLQTGSLLCFDKMVIKAHKLSLELKTIMGDLYRKHQDDIISGEFSRVMMEDWANNDVKLLAWREATGKTPFEQTPTASVEIGEQEYFDNGILMVAMVKAGVELAFETMTDAGIKAESAYYESLHEVPLIANLIARKKLYEMNKVISDTAEYGRVNDEIRNHPVEIVGKKLRAYMTAMKAGAGV